MSTARPMTRWSISSPGSTSATSSGSAPRARGAVAGVGVVSLASLLAAGGASAPTSAPPAPAASPTAAARAAQGATTSTPAKHSAKASRYRPDRFAGRAGTYYKMVWGVDSLAVKWGESGEVIRFTYRVLDADKAKVLND